MLVFIKFFNFHYRSHRSLFRIHLANFHFDAKMFRARFHMHVDAKDFVIQNIHFFLTQIECEIHLEKMSILTSFFFKSTLKNYRYSLISNLMLKITLNFCPIFKSQNSFKFFFKYTSVIRILFLAEQYLSWNNKKWTKITVVSINSFSNEHAMCNGHEITFVHDFSFWKRKKSE